MQRDQHMGKEFDDRHGRGKEEGEDERNQRQEKGRRHKRWERKNGKKRERAGSQTVVDALIILDEIKSEIMLLTHQQQGCICVSAFLVKDWIALINLIVLKILLKTQLIAQSFCDTL